MKKLTAVLTLVMIFMAQATAGDAPQTGAPAPSFKLQDQNGKWHSLEDYRGQWLVLYFYPKDDTPGCTTEACNFRDEIYKYKALGAAVLGVSLDDVASHEEFAKKYSLPFPLLADTENTVASRYGVLTSLGPLKFAKRETFLIGPDGVLVKHYDDVDPDTHSAELLQELEAQTGAAAKSNN